jgi:hypothetical protein
MDKVPKSQKFRLDVYVYLSPLSVGAIIPSNEGWLVDNQLERKHFDMPSWYLPGRLRTVAKSSVMIANIHNEIRTCHFQNTQALPLKAACSVILPAITTCCTYGVRITTSDHSDGTYGVRITSSDHSRRCDWGNYQFRAATSCVLRELRVPRRALALATLKPPSVGPWPKSEVVACYVRHCYQIRKCSRLRLR